MCLTYIQEIFLKTLLSAMLAVSYFLGSNLKVHLLLWPSLITIFNNENTQSTRMHAMIPLAKNLPCIKISLPLKSEASLAVYSHHVCSIVVLDDMGVTATFKKNHTHAQSACITSTYLSYWYDINAKYCKNLLVVLLLSLPFINLHIMFELNIMYTLV